MLQLLKPGQKIAGQPEFPLYYDNTLARATVGLNRSDAKYIIPSRIFSHKSLSDIIFKFESYNCLCIFHRSINITKAA